ncbi:MAG: AMP-binding protein, partial [Planctomycetota bacterium]
MLFTSGTTGVPKGVEISRRALALSTAARRRVYGELPERFLLLSPLHFDSSVAGLFWTLTEGGTLVLPAPGSERDARAIADCLDGERVTHTLMLPSLYGVVLESTTADQRRSLSTVIVAGEAATASLVRAHHAAAPGVRLENEYGPTEATVWATSMTLTASDASDPIPIGRPVGPVEVLVLGPDGRRVAPGVAGELHLGGPTLALGYGSDDPIASASLNERFAPRWSGGPRLYRTGDRVRFRDDGALVFLGRIDRQVKIRGHRIELGEVEAKLLSVTGVEEAAAVAATGPSGQRQLVAFAAGAELGTDAEDTLSRSLKESLSSSMVSQRIVVATSLPVTASGKVDRRRLAEEAAHALRLGALSDAAGRAPTGEVETTLHGIWKEVLGLGSISVDADFYALGGDSLTSIRVVSRAFKAGLEVDLAEFAADPTIAGMARAASVAKGVMEAPGSQDGPVPLTSIQRWFLRQELPERDHWNQAVRLNFALSNDPAADANALAARLRDLVARHDGLRLRARASGTGAWESSIVPASSAAPKIDTVDGRGLEGVELDRRLAGALRSLQTGLSLAEGPVIGAVLALRDHGVEAILVAHHMVVDAVSWATITDELVTPSSELNAAGASYRSWAHALESRANDPSAGALESEAEHWRSLAEMSYGSLGAPLGEVASEEVHLDSLEQDTTAVLLGEGNDAYGTRTREVLLAALSRALARRTGASAHLVDVEGHGREAHAIERGDLDVSRTVGWLTNVWPLALQEGPSFDGDPGTSVVAAKEAVRGVPSSGMGFGLLEVAPDAELREIHARLPKREVLFNYMGRLDGAGPSPAEALEDP